MSTLAEIIPDGLFVGTSLILQRDGRLLYGIRPVKQMGNDQVLELTGIGGGLEAEDASYTAGVRREAMEETGSDAAIVDCPVTWVVRGPDQVKQIVLSDDERPAALVYRYFRTPPHRPWHAINQGPSWLIVFLGQLLSKPEPTMELPWLIWLTAAQVVQTAREDVPLANLQAGGAELIICPGAPPPPAAIARLTDSQEALILALGQRALSVYESWCWGLSTEE